MRAKCWHVNCQARVKWLISNGEASVWVCGAHLNKALEQAIVGVDRAVFITPCTGGEIELGALRDVYVLEDFTQSECLKAKLLIRQGVFIYVLVGGVSKRYYSSYVFDTLELAREARLSFFRREIARAEEKKAHGESLLEAVTRQLWAFEEHGLKVKED